MTKIEMSLGPYRGSVENALKKVEASRVVPRIWDMDHTVWKMQPTEITNRLGWLVSPSKMRQQVADLKAFADEVRSAGYSHALLLGMGGSSLAPDVFRRTFGVREGFLDLAVLDSTDPAAVAARAGAVSPDKRLFIVSSKSGTTAEVSPFSNTSTTDRANGGAVRQECTSFAITDRATPLNEWPPAEVP
jgi:glucose-6-phosphate isomerase